VVFSIVSIFSLKSLLKEKLMVRNNDIDLNELKSKVDIIVLGEQYFGELVKSGNTYTVKSDRSITFDANKQIFMNWNGSMQKPSDILTLIMMNENVPLYGKHGTDGAVEILQAMAGEGNYTITPIEREKREKEVKEVNLEQIRYYANIELKDVSNFIPFNIEDGDTSYLHVHSHFRKLFESSKIFNVSQDKIEFLFGNVKNNATKGCIGYSKKFSCATIIIRDQLGDIVDDIKYRPTKPTNYTQWTDRKFMYANKSNRGKNFLFPFQKEFETILKRQGQEEKFFVVGEGIKNALNAVIYEMPYITIESVSYAMSKEVVNYIVNLIKEGYGLVTLFDGDDAGKTAFLKFIISILELGFQKDIKLDNEDIDVSIEKLKIVFQSTVNISINNFLDFNSKIDFTDYIVGENNEK
jgi:hypothetical protein